MHCRATDHLYVRANGSVPCNCDIGENVTLFAPDFQGTGGFDYAADCVNGPPFTELRQSFRRGEPYLDVCKDCFFFAPGEDPPEGNKDGTLERLTVIQLETSFLCALDCEACVPRTIRTDPAQSAMGAGPYNMPLPVLKRLVDDLARAQVDVGEFNVCGRGEPLMNPEFAELMAYAKRQFPDALLTLTTNGNARFFPGLLDLDYMTFSVDGATQAAYAEYRKGGSLEMALDLMRDVLRGRQPTQADGVHPLVAEHAAAKGLPIVRWKYLLFEHNDSDEELRRAQELALELGVDEMIFYFSHTWNRSKKYTSEEQIRDLPLFQIFDRKRSFMSNVSEDVDNVEYWERESQRRDSR